MCRRSGPDRNGNARPLRGVERAEGQLRFRRSAQTLGPPGRDSPKLFFLSPPTKLHSLAEHRFLSTAARPLFNRRENEQRKSRAKAAAGRRLCGAVEACAKVRQVEQEPARCFSFSR